MMIQEFANRMLAFANKQIEEFLSQNKDVEKIVFVGVKTGWYFKYRVTGRDTEWTLIIPWVEDVVYAELEFDNGYSYVDFKDTP